MTDKTLAEDKISEIKSNFDFFDRDGNGSIDEKEFGKLLLVIEPKATAEEIEKGFAIVDEDGDGSIDFTEFMEWWEKCWWQF